jgi:hypothetical protein
MGLSPLLARFLIGCLFLSAAPVPKTSVFPSPETLSYGVEWRLIYAGNARVTLAPATVGGKNGWQTGLHIESGGLVSKLYKLNDNFHGQYENQFCAASSTLDAVEGKRHRDTSVTYDRATGKASYLERDLLKNTVVRRSETDIPNCVHDVIGALLKLRTMRLDPGQSAQLPLSDGKKSVSARIEAQEREDIKTKLGTFKTIRYEAFLFNGVLYARSARLFVWLTDDPRRLPVQIRVRLQFVVGTITFTLEKDEPA